MTKKKAVIYSAVCLLFIALLSLYIVMLLRSADRVNTQHLNESLSLAESQIKNNIEYQARQIWFEFSKHYGNGDTSLGALLGFAELTEKEIGGSIYIADNSGIIHKDGGELDGRKLNIPLLKMVRYNGYAAVGMIVTQGQEGQEGQHIALIIPFEGEIPYYLIRVFSPYEFLKIVTANIAIPVEYFYLFDEWGNNVSGSSLTSNADGILFGTSVESGVAMYISDRDSNSLQKTEKQQHYNVYIPLTQPHSWFIGGRVDYSHFTYTSAGLVSSSVIIFVLLILILIMIVILDIINDQEKKKELFLVSSIDQLTGLINSRGLHGAVDTFTQDNSIVGYCFVYMDIVAFRRVNSMFGYSVGDILLRTIATAIKGKYFCGSRTSADCFCFLTKNSEHIAGEIEDTFYKAIEVSLGKSYLQMISFKFGVFPIFDGKVGFREMHEGALLALKGAKKSHSRNEVIFDSHLRKMIELQKKIEMNMIHALSKDEFIVYIHPQIIAESEECKRGEALIRWNSEFMGFLPPDQFISIFENNGFIVEIDFFMLTSILQFLQERYDAGLEMTTIAINQSRVTISFPNYFERIKAITSEFTVPLKYLELEITESTLENDLEKIVPLMRNLKKLGFSVAMDDFGSGFSSLNTLSILPIDILKIDRGFLQDSDTSERSRKIIRSIINMAKDLSIKIVCEGVETRGQVDFLKNLGCDIIQGFYYAKPMPINDFAICYLSGNKKINIIKDSGTEGSACEPK